MSGGLDVLAMKEDDITKLLAASTHLGDANVDFQMAQYVYKVKSDGQPIINLRKTWEKLMLAARVLACIENPNDICVLSNRPFGQRAILKFARYTGAHPIAGRFTPGTFTNQIQAAFREPRILVVSDPRADHQPITEASYVNIPVIGFCNTSSPLRHIDIAIPCNNSSKNSLGLMWWLLCREVLRLRGTISRDLPWDVMPDLFFYRDPEEVEKEEQAKAEQEREMAAMLTSEQPVEAPGDQWMEAAPGGTSDWAAETTVGGAGVGGAPIGAGGGGVPPPAGGFDQDWNVTASTHTKDWADDEWGGAEPQSVVSGGNWA